MKAKPIKCLQRCLLAEFTGNEKDNCFVDGIAWSSFFDGTFYY